MARFKPIHRGLKLLPVDFDRQIVPGTFEHARCYLIDHALDLSAYDVRYRNAACAVEALPPGAQHREACAITDGRRKGRSEPGKAPRVQTRWAISRRFGALGQNLGLRTTN